jgi:hypothetical protein
MTWCEALGVVGVVMSAAPQASGQLATLCCECCHHPLAIDRIATNTEYLSGKVTGGNWSARCAETPEYPRPPTCAVSHNVKHEAGTETSDAQRSSGVGSETGLLRTNSSNGKPIDVSFGDLRVERGLLTVSRWGFTWFIAKPQNWPTAEIVKRPRLFPGGQPSLKVVANQAHAPSDIATGGHFTIRAIPVTVLFTPQSAAKKLRPASDSYPGPHGGGSAKVMVLSSTSPNSRVAEPLTPRFLMKDSTLAAQFSW